MRQITLGKSSLSVPAIAVGCMQMKLLMQQMYESPEKTGTVFIWMQVMYFCNFRVICKMKRDYTTRSDHPSVCIISFVLILFI